MRKDSDSSELVLKGSTTLRLRNYGFVHDDCMILVPGKYHGPIMGFYAPRHFSRSFVDALISFPVLLSSLLVSAGSLSCTAPQRSILAFQHVYAACIYKHQVRNLQCIRKKMPLKMPIPKSLSSSALSMALSRRWQKIAWTASRRTSAFSAELLRAVWGSSGTGRDGAETEKGDMEM